jgi:hypothetical protein
VRSIRRPGKRRFPGLTQGSSFGRGRHERITKSKKIALAKENKNGN